MTTPQPTTPIPKTHKKVSDHINSGVFDITNLDAELTRTEIEQLVNRLGPLSSLTVGSDQNHLLRDLLEVISESVIYVTASGAKDYDYHCCFSKRATIVLEGNATRVLKFPGQQLFIVNNTGKDFRLHLFNYHLKDDKPRPHGSVYIRHGDKITF